MDNITNISMTANFNLQDKDKPVIFVLPYKFQRKRLEDMKNSMLKKNMAFTSTIDQTVTHVVTEFESLEQVEKHAAKDGLKLPEGALIVFTSWLVECLKRSEVVPVLDCHTLKKVETSSSVVDENKVSLEISDWACQRGAQLEHLNQKLTDALELLQLHAELRATDQDYARALAFRRASCVFKSLPYQVKDVRQLTGLKDIGGHVRRVVMDILNNGHSSEVEDIVSSDWFHQMKIFTGIFGVGPATAKNWLARGWKTVADVRQAGCPSGDWRMNWGLAFYEDLINPVSQKEADMFASIVRREAEQILPGAVVTLTGGFRRGKQTGHDVDLLITHPREGEEIELLPRLLSALARKDLVLIGHREKSSYRPDILYQDPRTTMRGQLDHFEKWLGICKFPQSFHEPSGAAPSEHVAAPPECVAAPSEHVAAPPEHVAAPSECVAAPSECVAAPPGGEVDQISCVRTIAGHISAGLGEDVAELDSQAAERSQLHSARDCSNEGNASDKVEESFDEMIEPHFKKSKLSERTDRHPAVIARSERNWLARRVDLIVCPNSQYYFALFGWTGSKHFNRSARLYAHKVLGMRLTSHGLYDLKQQKPVSASSEEEVFRHLQLTYREPTHRNC